MGSQTGKDRSVISRQKRQQQDADEMPSKGAFYLKITGPSGVEQVKVDSIVGNPTISFAYPFASPNAWIRGQPETGTTMMGILGSETKEIRPISYFDPKKATLAQRWQDTASQIRADSGQRVDDTLPYRALTPGDLDSGSNFAQQFMGLRDVYNARGGLSHFYMDSKKTSIETSQLVVEGPIHRAKKELNDELRFGVVRRAKNNATIQTLVRGLPSVNAQGIAQPFAKEFSVVLDWMGGPSKLLDHRQGIVVEDDGLEALSQRTRQTLRARYRWGTTLGPTSAEVDSVGNWTVANAVSATEGGSIEIPFGGISVNVGLRQTYRSKFDAELSSSLGNLTMSAATGFQLGTPANGEVSASLGLQLRSQGPVRIESLLPAGIQLGAFGVPKHPVLVGTPTYLAALQTLLNAESVQQGSLISYANSAVQAWEAIAPLMTVLDPTLTALKLCMKAGEAAFLLSGKTTILNTALAAHMKTLGTTPGGFLSSKVISE